MNEKQLLNAYMQIYAMDFNVKKDYIIVSNRKYERVYRICREMLFDPEFMFYKIQEYKKILKNELPKQS